MCSQIIYICSFSWSSIRSIIRRIPTTTLIGVISPPVVTSGTRSTCPAAITKPFPAVSEERP